MAGKSSGYWDAYDEDFVDAMLRLTGCDAKSVLVNEKTTRKCESLSNDFVAKDDHQLMSSPDGAGD
jgi:hypothetical protein